jgi:hypothetical protein
MPVVLVGLAGVTSGESPQRALLDTLWEQHMLEGKFIVMTLEDLGVKASEVHPKVVEPEEGQMVYGPGMSHRISVMKLGEGFFGNGGWVLSGGLLSRVRDGSIIFELYGKAVVRRLSYFPFPPHRDIPEEIGYEFFLLSRKPGVLRATVIRKWTFAPDEVILKNVGHDGRYPEVRAKLQFDATTRIATVIISGLKRPFEERVDLSSVFDSK